MRNVELIINCFLHGAAGVRKKRLIMFFTHSNGVIRFLFQCFYYGVPLASVLFSS